MANTVIRRPRATQPPLAVGLDLSNPLSKGLVSVVLQTCSNILVMRDALKHSRTWNVINAFNEPLVGTEKGLAHEVAVGGAFNNTTDIPLNPKDGCTIFFLFRPSVTPAAGGALVGFGTSAENNSIFQIQETSGAILNVIYRDSAGTAANFSGSTTLTNGKFYAVSAWTNGSNSHGLRYDGATYTNTTSVNPASYGTPTATTIFALYRAALANNNAGGAMIGPWYWNRVLSSQEIDAMTANPWQVFQPQQPILVNGFSAAGATTKPAYYYAQQ